MTDEEFFDSILDEVGWPIEYRGFFDLPNATLAEIWYAKTDGKGKLLTLGFDFDDTFPDLA